MADMDCSQSHHSQNDSSDENDRNNDCDVDELSQKMEGSSVAGGSQRSMSQNPCATPVMPASPGRLQSIPVSDPGAFYGPDDDPDQGSQREDPPASQESVNSQLSNSNSEQSSIRGQSRPRAAGGGPPTTQFANRMIFDSIYDSQRYPLNLRRFWHPDGLLVCTDNHRDMLYSQAKCMGLAVNAEKSEAYGVTWSFVFPFEGFGLPEQMIKAVHFFTIMESLSTHNKMTGCAVPTSNLLRNLLPNYHEKDIIGVVEGTTSEDMGSDSEHASGPVDFDDLLRSCEMSSSGMTYKALPLLRMNIGITGALYNVGVKEKRKLFGILYVHWLLNVDFMQLMLKTILAVPNAKTPNFDSVNKNRNALFDTFISLLVSQTQGISGGLAGQSPRDFLENPSGRLGAHNLCNPFWEPFKMLKSLETGATNVKFVGYPDIDWQGDPKAPGSGNDLRNYINHANGYTGHMVDWCSKIHEACKEFNTTVTEKRSRKKRKESAPMEDAPARTEFDLPVIYGVPIRLGAHTRFYTCATSYVPIFLEIRYLKTPNARETYDCFQINFGGIPMILQCLFRSFLFHGRAGIDSSKLDKIYLEDLDVKWNLAMLEEKFHSPNSDKALQFASAGCNMKSYYDLVSYIKSGVADGSVSPYNAVQVMIRHFELCWGLYIAWVGSGGSMSEKVIQSLRMLKKLYVVNPSKEIPFLWTVHDFVSKVIPRTPINILANPIAFAQRVILESLIHTNNAGQLLNPINLGNKLDLIISTILYHVGQNNKTLTPFGRCVEVAPCSGSAREIISGSKNEFVIKIGNPNGCGKDFSVIKKNEDEEILFRLLKEQGENLREIVIENDFTQTAIQLRTSVQCVEGRVISMPDPRTTYVSYAITEARGDLATQMKILIMYVNPRGGKASQTSSTTKEDPNTKKREVVSRNRVCDIFLVMRCTNTEISTKAIQEAYLTLIAVLHCRPPGATLFTPGDSDGKDLCSSYINRFECRSRPLSDEDEKIAGFVHTAAMLVAEHVGLMNQTMFPAEINPAVIGVLDWLLYVTQINWESIFNFACDGRRLNRLKRVYESRSSAMGLYAHTMKSLMQYDEYDVAIYKAAMAFHCDAVPLTNCGDLLYTMIYRCLSWVPIVYTRCYAIETNVPIVPVDIMIELLSTEDDAPPSQGTECRKWYDRVAAWLNQCVLQHRFCINPEGDTFSEYISSSGTIAGGVVEDGVLRVGKDQNAWMEQDFLAVPKLLASLAWKKYGKELEHTFAVSENSLAAAIDEMLKTFQVGGARLLGLDLNNVERHVNYFGLFGQLPFKGRKFSNEKRPFAIEHVWAKDDTRDPKAAYSVGIGLHWVQVLLLSSLTGDSIGTNMHPQIISDLARTLVRLVLSQSPAGVTPGRLVEVSSFNCYDCSLEPIDMGVGNDRPEHFLRAQNEQLAIEGILPDCPNFQNFAAEDILAVGPLCRWAQCIGCPVWKVPAIAEVTYYIRIGVLYIIYNETTGDTGGIEISDSGDVTMEYNDVIRSLDITIWQTELMEAGFIVLPLITRPAACVSMGDGGRLGCLVPPAEDASLNLSRVDRCYRAKTHVDTVQLMQPLQVMESLLPIGTLCYLKMETQSASPLIRRLNMPLSSDERLLHALRVRLSSPNVKHPVQGRIYVVFVVRRGVVSTGETIAVDPWELTTDKGRRSEIECLGQ